MGDEEKKEGGGEHINLKVVTQDGNEIYFKCKQTTPLQKLMHAFCNRQGVSTNSVRFLFDGNRINETQTPAQVCCPCEAWSVSGACSLHSLPYSHCAAACPEPHLVPLALLTHPSPDPWLLPWFGSSTWRTVSSTYDWVVVPAELPHPDA